MKIRTLRRRQARLSRGEPRFMDRYLGRAARRDLDAGMAKLHLAMKKFGDALKAVLIRSPS